MVRFWKRAYNRPVYISKPLKNIKMELIRIENFQILDRNNFNRWTQKIFIIIGKQIIIIILIIN